MESYNIKSRIVDNEKEYLIQTSNDAERGIVKTSIYVDGELLDTCFLPHSEDISNEEMAGLVETAHGDRKSELEYLLKYYHEVLQQGQPKVLYYLGTALFYKRMYREARQLFESALRLKTDFHEADYFLSQTELALNNIEAAVKAGKKALALRPEFADYRNNLGEVYLGAGMCEQAEAEFKNAIEKNVYYADAYYNLALAYMSGVLKRDQAQSRPELKSKCLDLFRKAVLISPDYQTATYEEAILALNQEDLKRAYLLLLSVREDKRERQRSEKSSHFNRFLIYSDWISERNMSERIAYLEEEIQRNPDYVDLYYELGLCHLHQSKLLWRKGMDYFKKALNINSDFGKAKGALDQAEEFYAGLADAVYDITEKSE
jgi:tetratricopeptide (TPR) repeat protein